MEIVYYAAVALAAVGVLLIVFFSIRLKPRSLYLDEHAANSGRNILYAFAVVVGLVGAFSLYHYWGQIFRSMDDVLYVVWLVLTMFFGMFVQVLYSAYRERRRLDDVTKTQLIVPLLFSIVVFSPIWSIATSSQRGFFVFQAAFLNGFFWESLVTAAKPPKPPAPPEG